MSEAESPSTSSSPSDGTALAKAPEKRPLATLASPVGGVLTNEKQVDWFLTIGEQWDKLPEDIKDSMLLLQRSFPAGQGGSYYLTPPQALMIVRYCRSKGLEIHSDHWWFDPRNYRMGSTVSGLRAEARYAGIDLGPPQFERMEREWPATAAKLTGYNGKDFGYRCKMRVGEGENFASYEAWLSTSAQRQRDGSLKAGPWADNPDHMLQVRAQSHCIKNSLGSGISQMPDDTDES